MNKAIRIIQNYLVYASPFILACLTWGSFKKESEILLGANFFTKIAWELLSWNLVLWFAALIVFLISLVFFADARERTLKRLANLKERDEREEQITGKAARAAYISTLSLLILLFFVSIFSIQIQKIPESEAANGRTGTLSIGLGFSLLDERKSEVSTPAGQIFETKDIPLSKSTILLIIIVWQLLIFNLTAKKESA